MHFKGYDCAKTVQNAVEIFQKADGNAIYINGGTDVMVKAREGSHYSDKHVIDISAIPELKCLEEDEHSITIGAGYTHTAIAGEPLLLQYAPLLCAASSEVGSPQIRNRGTIGGNIANASPAADTLGPLALYGATVILHGPEGRREVGLSEVITGPYRTSLKAGELICAVRIEKLSPDYRQRFFKLGRRKALAISRLTVSVAGQCAPDGTVAALRISLGSAFPRPTCFPDVNAIPLGKKPTQALMSQVAKAAAEKLPEIAGVRPSTLYKQPVSQKLIERLLCEVFEVNDNG